MGASSRRLTAMDQNSDGQQALLWGGAQMGTHMLLILGESVSASIGTCRPTSQKVCSCEISESAASEDFALPVIMVRKTSRKWSFLQPMRKERIEGGELTRGGREEKIGGKGLFWVDGKPCDLFSFPYLDSSSIQNILLNTIALNLWRTIMLIFKTWHTCAWYDDTGKTNGNLDLLCLKRENSESPECLFSVRCHLLALQFASCTSKKSELRISDYCKQGGSSSRRFYVTSVNISIIKVEPGEEM